MEHTPTPWKASKDCILNAHNVIVADVFDGSASEHTDREKAAEIAVEIVQAVNAHEALVTLAEEARDHLYTKQDMLRVRYMARAALALAEGKGE